MKKERLEKDQAKKNYLDSTLCFSTLKKIADHLSGLFDTKEICQEIVNVLATEFGMEYCSLMLVDEEGLLVNQAGFARGAENRSYLNQTFKVGEGVAGIAAKTNRSILIPDVEKDERFLRMPLSIKINSILSLPIPSNGRAIGVLNLSHPEKGFFNETHEGVFNILATIAGGFIRFADLKKELEGLNRELERRVIERTEEINRSYEYLKNLLENANDIVFTLDRMGRFVFFNQRIEEFGYARDELIGAHISSIFDEVDGRNKAVDSPMEEFKSFFSIFTREDGGSDDILNDKERRSRFEERASKLTGLINFLYHTKHSYELIMHEKEGRARNLLCSFSPLIDVNGLFSGILGIARDITERKRMEEKLARSEKLASLGFLISGIAHELNNKLVPIVGYSELLQRSLSNKRNLHMIDAINRSSVGAKYIVDSLLRFSRQEKPKKTYLNLNSLAKEACSILRYNLASFIKLRLELDPGLPLTLADGHQIEQVFLNILNNACQAVKEKGGVLTVRSYKSGQHLLFEFNDTGPGIPEANIPKIFDPFFTDKETGEGTGLGLSICYGIINEHMGDISVRSKPGDTTFVVRLPIVHDQDNGSVMMDQKRRPKRVARRRKRRKIFIIDDEELQLGLLEEILKRDYELSKADSCEKAIAILEKEEFDLVICDIKMPGMDGMMLYEWIVENRNQMEKRFFAITGNIMEPRVKRFMRIAGDRVITKPYRVEELINKIEDYVSRTA